MSEQMWKAGDRVYLPCWRCDGVVQRVTDRCGRIRVGVRYDNADGAPFFDEFAPCELQRRVKAAARRQ